MFSKRDIAKFFKKKKQSPKPLGKEWPAAVIWANIGARVGRTRNQILAQKPPGR